MELYRPEFRVFGFSDTFRVVLDNPEKIFLRFLDFFLEPKNVIFGFLHNEAIFWARKMPSFCKNPKITFSSSKEISKNCKKIYFFRIVQNYPKVTKKPKNSKFRPI